MNNTKEIIHKIISCAVMQKSIPPVEIDNLEEVYNQLKKHGMLAIGYDGLVRCGVDKAHPVMQQLFKDYVTAIMHNEGQLAEKDRILKIFEDNGIDYLPLKGCNMKKIYPKPELRAMGDADILIRAEDYPKTERILTEEKYIFDQQASHTRNWRAPKLYLEIHTRVIPDSDEDYFEYYQDSWSRAKNKNGHCYEYSPEDEFIYVFTHFARHFRTGGIGYRQLTDLWVLKRHYADMDYDYIGEEMESLGCREFYNNVMKTISACFEGGEETERTQIISEFIFNSGSWGTIDSHTVSLGLKGNAKGVKGKAKTKIHMFITARFPELKLIRIRYPVLNKYPWLLPLFWVIRWFDAVINRRHNVKNKIREVKVINEEEVLYRKQIFEAIGLKYNL